MEGFGQDLRVLGRVGFRVERDRGETGYEHDLKARIQLGGPPRELDAVHLRHDDIGQQQRKRLFTQSFIRAPAVIERNDIMPGIFQRFRKKPAHIIVIFSMLDTRHCKLPLLYFRFGGIRISPFAGYSPNSTE